VVELSSIELFTGAGGLALGLHEAGFRHLALAEWDRHSCRTLNENRALLGIDPSLPIEPTDVTRVSWGAFRGKVDLLAGGVPCQPFSLGGKHRGHEDDRNLFPEMLRAVREIEPTAILVENVKGLLRQSFRPYMDYVMRQLEMPGLEPLRAESWQQHDDRLRRAEHAYKRSGETLYRVARHLIQAADYGVPQTRERVLIVAYRNDTDLTWAPPVRSSNGGYLLHSEDALLFAQYVDGSYWRARGLAMPRSVPVRHRERVERIRSQLLPSEEARWLTVRDAISDLPAPLNHRPHPLHHDHIRNPGARRYAGHEGSALDWPSKTLKAGVHGVPGGENTIRYANGEVRYLSAREAARIQTFPDEYRFSGTWGEAFRQLGNAVPVQLARIVGEQIHAALLGREQLVAKPPELRASS
jgi:DNA (cytosine-5)-methyltransferase 1